VTSPDPGNQHTIALGFPVLCIFAFPHWIDDIKDICDTDILLDQNPGMEVMITISKNGSRNIGIEKIIAAAIPAEQFLRFKARITPTQSRPSALKKYGRSP